MSNLEKTCVSCGANFYISENDLEFYRKISPKFGETVCEIPPPTHCPHCRQQRRLTFRNERTLYRRNCDGCQKPIISIYAPTATAPVFCETCWWGDGWSGLGHGREFDFSRPFFAQFAELVRAVPRLYMFATKNENSDYTNGSLGNKDCYLTFVSDHNESVHFAYSTFSSSHSLDLMSSKNCELCYECVGCEGCYELRYSQNCSGCSSSFFLLNCRGSESCAFSTNLRQKKYQLFNQQLTQAEYAARLAELRLDTYAGWQAAVARFQALSAAAAVPATLSLNNENCLGDALYGSRNVYFSFDSHELEDCAYITYGNKAKNCLDGYVVVDGSELGLEVCSAIALFHGGFSFAIWFCAATWLSDLCSDGNNLFGCVGLKKAKYCILNKQYSKAEYEELVPRIIAHMQQTGEWGEFFPITLSPFAYNETVANEYFPLSREEIEARGWRWKEPEVSELTISNAISAANLPDNITEVTDEILKTPIICEVTGKPFKIQKAELDFYRKMQLPLPRLHPDARHAARLARRNPRALWPRECADCGAEIYTSFAPERSEKVLCENCYTKAVY